MDQNINDLFRLAQKWSPQEVGIEVSGQQGGFIPWIQKEMLTRNIFFNLASDSNSSKPGIRPNTNKMVRFNIVVPWFKANQIYWPIELKDTPEIMEVMTELQLVAASGFKSKHDDFIDTISQLASLNPWKPSEAVAGSKDGNTDIWEHDVDEGQGGLDSYIV